MRKLVYFIAVSLDGRIASPGDTFEAFPQQGDHIEMILRDWTDTMPAVALEALGLAADGSRFDTVLMGWNTYAAGLGATDNPYPHLRQVVFSRAAAGRTGPEGLEVTDREPVGLVRQLKSEPGGDIWLCGGGVLAAALLPEIDRLVLKVNPVVLGDGKPLFDGGGYDPRTFTLTTSTPYASGVIVNEYDRTRNPREERS